MKRTIIKIDELKCNGCGLCISGCHEGALQLIDGKASMISELYCDGLGACIGDCPEGAITLEEREAEPYDELATIERIAKKGESTIFAHINHLLDHSEVEYAQQAMDYLYKNNIKIDTSKLKINNNMNQEHENHSGCPGSKTIDFNDKQLNNNLNVQSIDNSSQLRQWPIQLHLLSPMAGYFKGADVLLAADCVAFAMGNFHQDYLKGRSLAIACPKLDSNKEVYVEKLTAMIDEAKINTLTIMMMEVPCCGGLLQMTRMATESAKRKVPVKAIYVSMQGEIISEEWL